MTADQSSANPNRLYFGDNLDILREHVADESVDLIYLDPPFNSNRNYAAPVGSATGKTSSPIASCYVLPATAPRATTLHWRGWCYNRREGYEFNC